MHKKCSREVALLALCAVHRKTGAFLSHFISPSDHLAREIAFGTERRLLSLDHIAEQLAHRGSLNLKLKEKMLLRMAIYQHLFMDRIPPHALVHEMVQVAKRYCHSRFTSFLNAALRRLVKSEWRLPDGESIEELSLCYSFPEFLIQQLLLEYGPLQTKNILQALNTPPQVTARRRSENGEITAVEGAEAEQLAKDPLYYIQGRAQASVLGQLAAHIYRTNLKNRNFGKEDLQNFRSERETIAEGQGASENGNYEANPAWPKTDSSGCFGIRSQPAKILDLCAAPGGKLIALAEHFPKSQLFANDSSKARLSKLEENLKKYKIAAELSCYSAAEYPEEQLFDLILLDVPCSNSGVLHKRPEARWRVTPEQLVQLHTVQWCCLQKAKRLLAKGGEIWYTTCSILACENEDIIKKAARELNLTLLETPIKHLPHEEMQEGAFGCRLTS